MSRNYKILLYSLISILLVWFLYKVGTGTDTAHKKAQDLILNLSEYRDEGMATAWEQLKHRISIQPFNLAALIIFVLAILHTLCANYFTDCAEKRRENNQRLKREIIDDFGVEILDLLGEVEVIFGIWVIPLMIIMIFYYDWATVVSYLNHLKYTEALFVIVIMAIASTKPIIKITEKCLLSIAQIGGGTIKAWWLTIMTVGPIAGSLITEPGAMTISAFMLSNHFFCYQPKPIFAYATLGLLFVNISTGGVFTSFAAPPILMISKPWAWDTPFMLYHFAWKATLGILISNILYFIIFRKEFDQLEMSKNQQDNQMQLQKDDVEIPFWITLVHSFFLVWAVIHNHYPVIFIGAFLLFLGFQKATARYQSDIRLRAPVLVGYFLAGLIVHGSLQGWWISPVIGHVSQNVLMGLTIVLTAFADNAQITFLGSLIPSFNDQMKYALVSGAVTGGGLTVIANAPNPLGQALLSRFFDRGISAKKLFLAALTPTLIMGFIFWIFQPS